MTLTTLATAYLLGGITFIPLLLAAVLIPAWLLLPRSSKENGSVTGSRADNEGLREKGQKIAGDGIEEQDSSVSLDGTAAASATFAVLRTYHFPSAVAALNARSSGSGNTSASVSVPNGVADSREAEVAGSSSSESVYQSMYRSVFDRSRNNANASSSVLEHSADGAQEGSRVRRKAVSASVFYIVLRHGHLMLYDSAAQLEVRHVISLEHHSVSLIDDEEDERTLADADLFIKRTAILLSPKQSAMPNGLSTGQRASPSSQPPKPFYLFCSSCSEKEDFYHALLSARTPPPVPQAIAPEDLIKLQSTLHSTSLTPETRALNALVGRIFLSVHRTAFLEDLIRNKIEKKIARVQKPAFIATLSVKTIHLGDSAPVLSQPRLKDINISGEMTLSFDLRYTGAAQVVIAALAKLELGTRFKARSVDLLLSTSLRRMSGKVLIKVKPPPSNRVWFCFEATPDMEIKVEPIVSSRQITYNFILRAIEERIRGVIAETLVRPNWDDVPFFDTRRQRVRGGIWRDEGNVHDGGEGIASLAMAAQGDTPTHNKADEKSVSTPTLATLAADMDSSAASSTSDIASTEAIASSTSTSMEQPRALRHRSVASLPLAPPPPSQRQPPAPAKPLRSPSFISPPPSTPSVAVNDASGVPVRSDDAEIQSKKWRSRTSLQGTGRREAVEAVREMRDRSMAAVNPVQADSELHNEDAQPYEGDGDENLRRDLSDILPTTPPVSAAKSRTDSEQSTADSASSATSRQQQRKNLLAATAAATTAARNWGWNAIANRTGAGRGTARPMSAHSSANSSQTSLQTQQPIGRGQPLPPPGTPLPGPQKGLFSGLSAVGVNTTLRRKPVLPPRKAATMPPGYDTTAQGGSTVQLGGQAPSDGSGHDPGTERQDTAIVEEFGPWRENSGMAPSLDADHDGLLGSAGDSTVLEKEALDGMTNSQAATGMNGRRPSAQGDTGQAEKVPPPLPPRRHVNRTWPPAPHVDSDDDEPQSLHDLDNESVTPVLRAENEHGVNEDLGSISSVGDNDMTRQSPDLARTQEVGQNMSRSMQESPNSSQISLTETDAAGTDSHGNADMTLLSEGQDPVEVNSAMSHEF